MVERSPIYSAKHRSLKIGYIEGAEAFDLSGNKRCNYNPKTGNLLELRQWESHWPRFFGEFFRRLIRDC